mmetsp:Transcript_105899/g.252638  ORF Transcript_105899/g.252638 Transcript_105899/m.252638 type:complete len:224 (-) Transcript_105899:657-1328(-)
MALPLAEWMAFIQSGILVQSLAAVLGQCVSSASTKILGLFQAGLIDMYTSSILSPTASTSFGRCSAAKTNSAEKVRFTSLVSSRFTRSRALKRVSILLFWKTRSRTFGSVLLIIIFKIPFRESESLTVPKAFRYCWASFRGSVELPAAGLGIWLSSWVQPSANIFSCSLRSCSLGLGFRLATFSWSSMTSVGTAMAALAFGKSLGRSAKWVQKRNAAWKRFRA